MTPAERLLAAADLLEKRAGEATEGPWKTKAELDGMLHGKETVVWAKGYRVVTVGQTRTHHHKAAEANIAYIATMHPEVGKALAALLRWEADAVAFNDGRCALAIADLLLAGAS